MSLSGKVTYLCMGACSWLFQRSAHTDRETIIISSVNVTNPPPLLEGTVVDLKISKAV